eukprot:INCI15775.1.p1 GENE.INCI15775.1~~INCI15775.1.p1  ORF type:complete len:811 (-),score=118.66 INCI15775.1:231-2663(-)
MSASSPSTPTNRRTAPMFELDILDECDPDSELNAGLDIDANIVFSPLQPPQPSSKVAASLLNSVDALSPSAMIAETLSNSFDDVTHSHPYESNSHTTHSTFDNERFTRRTNVAGISRRQPRLSTPPRHRPETVLHHLRMESLRGENDVAAQPVVRSSSSNSLARLEKLRNDPRQESQSPTSRKAKRSDDWLARHPDALQFLSESPQQCSAMQGTRSTTSETDCDDCGPMHSKACKTQPMASALKFQRMTSFASSSSQSSSGTFSSTPATPADVDVAHIHPAQKPGNSVKDGDPFTDIDLDDVSITLLNLYVKGRNKRSSNTRSSASSATSSVSPSIAAASTKPWASLVANPASRDLARTFSAPVTAADVSGQRSAGSSGRNQSPSGSAIERSDSITLLSSAVRGLYKGAKPTAIEAGNLSGVYKLYDGPTLSPVAVFKPRDEEFAADIGTGGIDAVNEGGEMEKFELGRPNPNYPGLRIGEGALRERAAFVLDRNYGGFSGVPTTTLTRIKAGNSVFRTKRHSGSHDETEKLPSSSKSEASSGSNSVAASTQAPFVETTELDKGEKAEKDEGLDGEDDEEEAEGQSNDSTPCSGPDSEQSDDELIEGSMQQFVTYETTVGDLSINILPAAEVRKIAILDVRLFNGDRHGDNILVQTPPGRPHAYSAARLIPIDHGSCLPDFRFLSVTEFVWWNAKAAHDPFSDEELQYISNLDIVRDAAHLRSLGIREECVATCVICTNLLKMCSRAGLNLHQIVSLIRRPYEYAADGTQKSSVLEGWIEEALCECAGYKAIVEVGYDRVVRFLLVATIR